MQAEMDAALALALKKGAVNEAGEMVFASRILKLPTATGLALPVRSVLFPDDLERNVATPTYISDVAVAIAAGREIPARSKAAKAKGRASSDNGDDGGSRRRHRGSVTSTQSTESPGEEEKKDLDAIVRIAKYVATEPPRGTAEGEYLMLPRQGKDKCAMVHEATNIMLVGGMAPNALGAHRWLREHPGWRMAHEAELQAVLARTSEFRINVPKAGILLSKSEDDKEKRDSVAGGERGGGGD